MAEMVSRWSKLGMFFVSPSSSTVPALSLSMLWFIRCSASWRALARETDEGAGRAPVGEALALLLMLLLLLSDRPWGGVSISRAAWYRSSDKLMSRDVPLACQQSHL